MTISPTFKVTFITTHEHYITFSSFSRRFQPKYTSSHFPVCDNDFASGECSHRPASPWLLLWDMAVRQGVITRQLDSWF